MIKRLGLIIVLLLLLGWPVMADGSQGKIQGSVVNGTRGSSSVTSQEITLKILTGDNQTDSITTVSDTSGRFEFSGLVTDPSYQYRVALTYQGVAYSSSVLSFSSDPVIETEIPVYDTTADPSVVSVMASHMVIYPQPEYLWIAEYQVFANDSDRTFVGSKQILDGKKETLRISLPEGAAHFQPEFGLVAGNFIQDSSGVSDTTPLPPGTREVGYFYIIAGNADGYALQPRFNYPTGSFNLLVQGKSLSVSGEGLDSQPPIDIEGEAYQYYASQRLEAGKTLSFSLSPQSVSNSDQAVTWLVALLLAASVGIGGYLLLRKRLFHAAGPADYGEAIEERLAELARLDDDFEDGKISKEDYLRLRTENKRQLAGMLKRPKE
jgi:hypothetical protein